MGGVMMEWESGKVRIEWWCEGCVGSVGGVVAK